MTNREKTFQEIFDSSGFFEIDAADAEDRHRYICTCRCHRDPRFKAYEPLCKCQDEREKH